MYMCTSGDIVILTMSTTTDNTLLLVTDNHTLFFSYLCHISMSVAQCIG